MNKKQGFIFRLVCTALSAILLGSQLTLIETGQPNAILFVLGVVGTFMGCMNVYDMFESECKDAE